MRNCWWALTVSANAGYRQCTLFPKRNETRAAEGNARVALVSRKDGTARRTTRTYLEKQTQRQQQYVNIPSTQNHDVFNITVFITNEKSRRTEWLFCTNWYITCEFEVLVAMSVRYTVLLVRDTVWFKTGLQRIWQSSINKMEAAGYYELLVPLYHTIRRRTPQETSVAIKFIFFR